MSRDVVENVLLQLDVSAAMGPDVVHFCILRAYAAEIAQLLTMISLNW